MEKKERTHGPLYIAGAKIPSNHGSSFGFAPQLLPTGRFDMFGIQIGKLKSSQPGWKNESHQPVQPSGKATKDLRNHIFKKMKLKLKTRGLHYMFTSKCYLRDLRVAASLFCMLWKFFKKDPESLDNFVRIYARDTEELFVKGSWDKTGTFNIRVCHIGTKGDLPALTRMGMIT